MKCFPFSFVLSVRGGGGEEATSPIYFSCIENHFDAVLFERTHFYFACIFH